MGKRGPQPGSKPRVTDDRTLTPKQHAFVMEYVIDLNASQAALRAGYSEKSAPWQGQQLLTKPHIAAAVQELMDARAARCGLTADRVLKEIEKLSFSDVRSLFDESGKLRAIHNMPDDVAASIAGVEVVTRNRPGPDGVEVEYVNKIKFWDKRGSLELAGKHLKLFTDKVELTGRDGGAIEYTNTERAARLAAILDRAQKRAAEDGK